MTNTRIARTPHSAAPFDAQSSALARIYARALQRYREKQMAAEPAPEPDGRDGTTVQGDSADAPIIQE